MVSLFYLLSLPPLLGLLPAHCCLAFNLAEPHLFFSLSWLLPYLATGLYCWTTPSLQQVDIPFLCYHFRKHLEVDIVLAIQHSVCYSWLSSLHWKMLLAIHITDILWHNYYVLMTILLLQATMWLLSNINSISTTSGRKIQWQFSWKTAFGPKKLALSKTWLYGPTH